MANKSKLIVALDLETIDEAREMWRRLRGMVGMFKIGSQLFTHAGPSIVQEIVEAGERVFLDLKFHDIPNTVAAASAEATRLGVSLLNVHALGGGEMMRRAAEAVRNVSVRENMLRPNLIAVTVLTSSDELTLKETGYESSPKTQVARLAELAAVCGLDGVVASGHEIQTVRACVPRKGFLIVTPGVRITSVGSPVTDDDQKRVMTPNDAIRAGADFIVVGRPITQAPDPARAAHEIVEQIG